MPLFNSIWENKIQAIYEPSLQMLYKDHKTWPNSSPDQYPNSWSHVYFYCKTAGFIKEGLNNISFSSITSTPPLPLPQKQKEINCWSLIQVTRGKKEESMKEGSVWATVQAGILVLHLQNGCRKIFLGKSLFTLLQESIAGAENAASYCVFITCVSPPLSLLCIITWSFLWEFPQKKKKKPSLQHSSYPDWFRVVFDISANKGVSQDQKPWEQSKSLDASLPNAPVNQPCPPSASVRLYFEMLHVSYVQNWFCWHFSWSSDQTFLRRVNCMQNVACFKYFC